MSTINLIKSFLALPPEAMPSAEWVDGMDDNGSPWRHLRDYVRNQQELNHLGETVRLAADRDGWRDGVTVRLS